MATPLRNIRVSDELWQAAQAKAAQEGTTVTTVIVEALKAYTGADKIHVFPGNR
ncbi:MULTISPECIES: hypothetical protein [Rhodococcus]|uniref:hypothetical protein n=1 Tax=Rhodococcus TaxID=1827 RepID=UPI00135B717F|nr:MULTISPECIES: hypothetical protein [Rhodococcus]KAF0959800.1 hypothetical protein MLGJGCBP_07136 [Rhodococcus sp. T7]MBA8960134.1 putative HicB family RNase H-like nuclease [Rhodococcus opacus]MBP2205699.1 putative HicB family RNase H-like nuclease [Rhodococcus opacus]UZG58228.1 hypothetical protein ONE62_13315 [Rhodococcus opacus]